MKENVILEGHQKINRDMHPDWSEDKIDLKSAMDMQADILADEGGQNFSFGDEIMRMLIDRTKIWIEQNLPELFIRLRNAFEYLLDTLTEWIQRGIDWVIDNLPEFF